MIVTYVCEPPLISVMKDFFANDIGMLWAPVTNVLAAFPPRVGADVLSRKYPELDAKLKSEWATDPVEPDAWLPDVEIYVNPLGRSGP